MKILVEKLKSKGLVLLCILICTIFTSCAFQYVSTPQYVPLNEKKGELKINQLANGVQIGYSFFDHFSLFSTGSFWTGGSNSLWASKENGGAYFQDGQGYEINIGSSYFNKYKFFNYEILYGGGFGEMKYSNRRDYVEDYKFDLHTPKFDFFIQPDIGFKVKNNLELGLCSRFSYQCFYNIQTSTVFGSNIVSEPNDRYFADKSQLNLIFWEPAFSLKLGSDKFKVIMLFATTQNINNKPIIYQKLYFNLGFHLNFDLISRQ